MRNILITGAGGLVGLNLLTKMQDKHYNIIAIDKNSKRIQLIKEMYPDIETHCIDLATDSKSWKYLFDEIETVIQLHAQIQDLEEKPYWDNNVYSVEKVLECSKKCKHFIHTSSSVVISVSNDLYVKTKAQGEKLVVQSNLPYTVLRPTLMYGCFDYKHLGFLTSLMEKLPVLPFPGHGKYIRQPLYVLDLCDIILKAINKGSTHNVHNLIGKEKIFFLDLLKIIRKKRKINCMLLPLPISLFAFLVKSWGKVVGKAPFVKDQILALTAGDIFSDEDWEREFDVTYTSFDDAFDQIINSHYKDYRSGHLE